MSGNTMCRKVEHVELALIDEMTYENNCSNIYSDIMLVHQAFPGVSFREVTLTADFLGYSLEAPIVIEGMTGGHPATAKINEKLALLASKAKVALGIGSQRALIENYSEEVLKTYKIVRDMAKEVPVIGNIGITILGKYSYSKVAEAVNSIDIDALAVHLNPAQELIQPEGDTSFTQDLLDKLADLRKEIAMPVIVKEVGTGLSMEVARVFAKIGVEIFDVAGACGTSWIKIEGARAKRAGDLLRAALAEELSSWGIPTPISVIECRYAVPQSTIIASGGVWSSYKAAINIALGADLVGIARPILKALFNGGVERGLEYLNLFIEGLKAIMFLTGSSSVLELKKKPLYMGSRILSYMRSRGINVDDYLVSKGG
ncbi:MAG: type 2 isopentenyl-diphosphate Delta-isomerase [Desulfurococcaceae archaeon]